MSFCKDKPCPTCPWRKSSTAGGADIKGFSIEQMRNLANTVPPRGSNDDGFYKVMACHHSREGDEYACAGYVAVQGAQNIEVRLLASIHDKSIVAVVDACRDIELYPDFHTMLDAYEEAYAKLEA